VDTAVQALEYGALQYLSKPVEMKELERSVERAIRLHRMAAMKREAMRLLGSSANLTGDRAGLEASYEQALEKLRMVFQPIVQTADRAIYGNEALMRSDEPSLPHPGAILEAGERLDRLPELGRKIRALTTHAVEDADGDFCIFVNLHASDLLDKTLCSPDAPLSRIAERVVLEITERTALEDIRDARGRVAALREMGFRIAVDDLGAGYAGLTSFATLEPEIVKLDMTLVRDVHQLPMKQKLIGSMTTLCKDMGMMVVAEGVETAQERETLIELGCDLLQGYLLAKPGPPFPEITW